LNDLRRISHELHNRLAVVAGFATLIEDRIDGIPDESLRRIIAELVGSAGAAAELLAPWRTSLPADASPGPQPVAPPLGGNLLVLEDNDDHFAAVLAMLRRSGAQDWPVLRAASLAEARALVLDTAPQCTLVDLSLPDAAGLDAVAQMRAASPHQPIVVVTGVDDQSVGIDAVRLGAQDYLVKGHFAGDSLVRSILYSVERCRVDRALAHQALHDSLTGLANRDLLLDRLKLSLARHSRHGGLVAVMFVDLDRFKLVNDSLGHHVGDELLIAVAERLRATVRRTDTVARFGGDEFVVLCEDLGSEAEAAGIADHLLGLFAAPFPCAGGAHHLTASIGVALAATPHGTAETVLADADTAMYRAKERGKARWELFDDGMRVRVVERFETEHALHHATVSGQLRLHYQPIVELAAGRAVGAEALLRWEHPERGLLAPDQFLAVAEDTGQILEIGRWVLDEACRQARSWRDEGIVDEEWTMWVNISPVQLEQPNATDIVTAALQAHGLPPASLGLEITETAIIRDAEATVVDLHRLKGLGVRFAIDDFGTGFSSLSWLRRCPVDQLKIDSSFVRGVGSDPEDTAIVESCIALARALGYVAVAEGVESEEQAAVLRQMGCTLGQGIHLAPPRPAEDWAVSPLRQ
jgi:diguanylate cyclase